MGEPGNQDLTAAIAAVVVLLAIIVGIIVFIFKMQGAEEEKKPAEKKPRARGAMDRMQRGAAAAAAGDGEDGEDEEDDDAPQKGGKKTARKAAKAQEKDEERAAQKKAQEDKEKANNVKAEKYAKKLADRDAERLKREEEERLAQEEKEKKEAEEFDQWKGMFSVDAEGANAGGEEGENALEKFVDYVRMRKVVLLEDLAAEFRLKTSDAIDRLNTLEKAGRLSGVFDDRGKFIYVTTEEMENVANWLKQKGRIPRADLVNSCNKLVRLVPTEEDKERIKQEEKSAMSALVTEEDDAQ